MNLVVGCPVRERQWIIRRWFEHADVALRNNGIKPQDVTFTFVVNENDPTIHEIDRACLDLNYSRIVIHDTVTTPNGDTRRRWGWNRYVEMAAVRNLLLEHVRYIEPDAFWSVDSDVLLHPDALTGTIDAMTRGLFSAVGGHIYMTDRGTRYPSYANRNAGGGLLRTDAFGVFPVDVVMAVVFMLPQAYNVDYHAHRSGEDIGWSLAAKRAGCRLGWTGTPVSKHVMRPELLDVIDPRVGF